MLFEGQVNPKEIAAPSVKDLEAARELIQENEILKNSARVKMLLENDFVNEEGRQLDPGNFLSAMLDYLSKNNNPTEEELDTKIEENMAVFARATR